MNAQFVKTFDIARRASFGLQVVDFLVLILVFWVNRYLIFQLQHSAWIFVLHICIQRNYNFYGNSTAKCGSGLCTLYLNNHLSKCVSYFNRNIIKFSKYFTLFWHFPWRNILPPILEGHSSTEDTGKILNPKKATREQAAIKVQQKSQNESLLPTDWQQTLSSRTRSGAWSEHTNVSKNEERKNKPLLFLGPLLFLTYVNDIWRNTESNIRLFANDCIIYRKITDTKDVENLQKALNRLGEWAVENEMKLNPDKSKTVSFTKDRVKERTRYYFGEQLIPEASSFKYLAIFSNILCLYNIFFKYPTDAAVCSQFYSTARFTLHVSGVLHTHHHEYNFNCIYSLRY